MYARYCLSCNHESLFFRVFLNSNHKISRHKSSRKFPPHLTVVLIEFRSEIYDLKNTLRRRDTNQRPSTTKFRDVGDRWAGWAIPHSCFGRSVNPISSRGGRMCPPKLLLAHPALSSFLRHGV